MGLSVRKEGVADGVQWTMDQKVQKVVLCSSARHIFFLCLHPYKVNGYQCIRSLEQSGKMLADNL